MNIKELRKAQKLSQSEFATKLGISAATVSQLETGRMKLSPKIAAKVKEVFGEEAEAAEGKQPAAEKAPAKEAAAGAPAAKKIPAKKPAGAAKPAKVLKFELYVQSPYGGNITPEEILAKIPEGTEACYVRVDQNLIWWIRGDESGAVEIWE